MNSKEYVENHDFGYGKDEEQQIIKLRLRNEDDLKEYIKLAMENAFDLPCDDLLIKFDSDNSVQIVIE